MNYANFLNAVKILVGVVVGISALVYLALQLKAPPEPGPCSPKGYPGRCYQLDPDVCEIIWKKASLDCDALIKKLPVGPGRLTGPIVAKCQMVGLDKAFHFSRRSTPECDAAFDDLDAWRRRNDINP